jgi:hypothetical protein
MLVGGALSGSLGRTVPARRVARLCGSCVAGVRVVLVLVGHRDEDECPEERIAIA